MPYLLSPELPAIRDATGTGTSFNIPNSGIQPHVSGDILVCCLNADGANQPSLPTSAGGGTWVSRHNNTGTGHAHRIATLVATSADEDCSWTLSGADTSGGWVGVVKGNGGTLAYDTSTIRSADDSTEPFAGVAITPAANSLVLTFLTTDGAIGPICQPGPINVIGFDTGADSIGVAYTYRKPSSAYAARDWFSGVSNDNTMAVSISFTDDASEDVVNGYLDDDTVATMFLPGGIGAKNSWTWDVTTAYGVTLFGQRDQTQAWSNDGAATWVDETTDVNDVGTADVTLQGTGVGNAWYFSYTAPFDGMAIAISTAQSAGTLVWEYWNGSTWATLTVSGVFTATGNVKFTWTRPSAWAATTVNGSGGSNYYVRVRVSSGLTTAPILSTAYIGGIISGTFDAPAAVADAHLNPYSNATNTTGAQSTALSFVGMSVDRSVDADMSNGLFYFFHKAVAGRDYLVDPCKMIQPVDGSVIDRRGGIIAILVDGNTNYEGYVFHAKGVTSSNPFDWNTAVIDLNGTPAYRFLSKGSLNKAAVRAVYFVVQPEFGACQFQICNVMTCSLIVVAGGGQFTGGANPILFDEFVRVVNNGMSYSQMIKKLGKTGFVYAPIQYGGGDTLNIDLTGVTMQLPNPYSTTEMSYNGADDKLNQIFFGQTSADRFTLVNSIWNTGQPHQWGFHASHAAATVVDCTGAKVLGPWNVLLRANASGHVDGITFGEPGNGLTSLDLNSCAIDSGTFIDSLVVADSPADAADLTNCAFIKTAGTRHGIEIIGAAADFSLDGNTFTGFAGTDGSTGNEAIYVNIATGTVNISITGGGSTPSIRTAGATVNVINTVPVTLTGLKDDTEVRVLDNTTGDFLAGTETATDGTTDNRSFTFSLTAALTVDIAIFNVTYILPPNNRIENFVIPGSATSIPISQVVDRVFNV